MFSRAELPIPEHRAVQNESASTVYTRLKSADQAFAVSVHPAKQVVGDPAFTYGVPRGTLLENVNPIASSICERHHGLHQNSGLPEFCTDCELQIG